MRINEKELVLIEGAKPWVNIIRKLLHERGWTYQDLADEVGATIGTVSGWIGEKGRNKLNSDPSLSLFIKIAEAFGVSVEYLLGKRKCKTPKHEEIHKTLGLSDKAIYALKKTIKHNDLREDRSLKKKIDALNFIVENISDTQLLENLHNYLLADYYYESSNGKELNFATTIVSKSNEDGEGRDLFFRESINKIFYTEIMHDLVRLKDRLDLAKKKSYEQEKADYLLYEQGHKEEILQDLWDTMDEYSGEESE